MLTFGGKLQGLVKKEGSKPTYPPPSIWPRWGQSGDSALKLCSWVEEETPKLWSSKDMCPTTDFSPKAAYCSLSGLWTCDIGVAFPVMVKAMEKQRLRGNEPCLLY